MSHWWPINEPEPPVCANCRHEAYYHTPNRHGVLVCVAPVDGQMKCDCHEKGGYAAKKKPADGKGREGK